MRFQDGEHSVLHREMMVRTAAVMFGGAAAIDMAERLVPGGQTFSIVPGVGSFAFAGLLLLYGRWLPVWLMAALGPIGVGMIGYALATTRGAGDGAVLYVWPVLWEAYFFGRWGAFVIVACVAVTHGLALLAMPAGLGNADRWIDVVAAMSVASAVVQMLAARNARLLNRISTQARVDELTGLLNRRGFDERAEVELARARREQLSLGVVVFDLDHFKRVNDDFGHEVGDRVLGQFAGCLLSQARAADVAARLGGEEFVVLLPGAKLDEAVAFGDRVRMALRELEAGSGPQATVSAGATAETAPDDIDRLLKHADMALYAAKSQGRDCTVSVAGSQLQTSRRRGRH